MIFTSMDWTSWDERLLLYLNNLGNEKWDAFWLYITDQHAWWWFYLLLLAWIFYQWGIRRGLMVAVALILLLSLNDQLINTVKALTQRVRPCNVETLKAQLRILKCSSQYSFFSGHAANSFLVASYLWFSSEKGHRWLWILFVWAALTAYSRVYAGVHFPSDVLAGITEGFVLGMLTGSFVRKITKKMKDKTS